ncbi:hypothetical protein G9A89_014332 [Geosiphon pyriformis]|nr:hypothetical protein G9A89_014332 [Geosiphon pyriformis]
MVIVSVAKFKTKREANFPEYLPIKHVDLSPPKRNFLNITEEQKRSKIDVDLHFQKVLVEDQGLLAMLANNAYYAMQAACLKDESDRLYGRFFVGMSKSLNPITGAYQQIILTFKSKERGYILWKMQKSTLIGYPRIEGALVDQSHFNVWLKGRKKFWTKMENLKLKSDFNVNKDYFTFTGFGRAGIIAVCAALEFASKYAVKPTVVTFGQPQMGNMKFAEFVATQITLYRVTYRDDYTPGVPKYGYSFEGKAIDYFQLSGEYWIPFQDQCECSPLFTKTSDLEPPIKFPSVYKCFEVGTLNEHPDCNKNRNKRRRKDGRLVRTHEGNDHFGPYFGYMMGICPSEPVNI